MRSMSPAGGGIKGGGSFKKITFKEISKGNYYKKLKIH